MTLHRELKKKLKAQSNADSRLLVLWVSLKTLVLGLIHYATLLWQHNPLRIICQRQRRMYFVESYGEVLIKPQLKERVLDVFLSDFRRRQRLLNWVHSKTRTMGVADFSNSWHDGIALCALLESICPGVCPSYHLLSHLNRVKNCRLGLKLANKYLYVPMDLISPEEMAIANKSSENKIIQYISVLRWASENIKEKWSSLHESLIAAKSGKCFAKGSGLRNGIVGKRSKFTIIVSDTIGVFNMLVEVRGPNNEYCGERLVSLHQAKGVLDKSFDINNPNNDAIKYLEDGAGNTFVRKKVPPRYAMDSSELIHLDFQCGDEGTFHVTFVPRRAGLHAVAVKWQNHHVENSPFRIKVYKASNVSSKNLKGAQEKRVIYDSLSFTTYGGGSQDSLDNHEVVEEGATPETATKDGRSLSAMAKSRAYTKGRQLTVTRRRVLRRIITRNGEDIVIEEAISPSMSRQSSMTDNSDEDNRGYRKDDRRSSPNRYTRSQSPNLTHQDTPVSLRPVPEERQNSKDDNTTGTDRHLRTTAKETNQDNTKSKSPKREEHVTSANISPKKNDTANISPKKNDTLEIITRGSMAANKNAIEPESNKLSNDNANILLKENDLNRSTVDSTNVLKDRVAKSPLKRTFSIHEHPKTPARRTVSDGPLFQLRKQLATPVLIPSDRSETGSEVSSDDKNSVTDDDGGISGPALKILHSSSLKKACMYISDKAFTHTISSLGDDDVFVDSFEVSNKPKTKLRATQSLPIMRRMWPMEGHDSRMFLEFGTSFDAMASASLDGRVGGDGIYDYTSDESSKVSSARLENIMTVDEDGNVSMNRFDCVADLTGRERRKSQAEIHTEICNAHGYIPDPNYDIDHETTGESTSSHVDHSEIVKKNSSVKDSKINLSADRLKKRESFEEVIKELESLTSPKSEPSRRFRAAKYANMPATDVKHLTKHRRNLMRQWTVFGNRSSESSSDTERKIRKKIKTIDSSVSVDSSSVLKFEFKPVFQGINMPTKSDSRKERETEVFIVMPKAKVDKSTQVSEDEIKQETGWDTIEGMYLLLRKISVKVPYTVCGNLESPSILADVQTCLKISEDDCDVSRETADTQHVDLTISDSENVGLDDLRPSKANDQTGQIGNADLLRVDSWLENNGMSLMEVDQFSPMRQLTVETNDSGFDDNPSFNRQARFSLPSLRSVNGHVRLHRRPYKGQILLDRKLVVSSSQSVSLERREQGHEADDELMHNSSLEHQSKQQRRRHRMPCRQESVSMSDSEINQRRQTNKRKVFQSKRYPVRAGAGDKKRERLAAVDYTSDDRCDTLKEKSRTNDVGNAITDKQDPSVGLEDNFDVSQLDTSCVFDDNKAFDQDGTINNNKNEAHSLSLRKSRSSTRSKSSSVDSNYFGFGISKRGRDVLVSQLGDFQSLCPTEEIPNEEAAFLLENTQSFGQNGVPSDLMTDSNENIVNNENEDDSENEDAITDDTDLKVRSQSWDCILSDSTCEIEQDEMANTSETNLSVLGSDSGSDDIGDKQATTESISAFDMFSSFDHSHMNDVLPRQSSTCSREGDDVTATSNEGLTSGSQTVVKVAGVGHRYGQVGASNSFQVWIENPSTGSLSVNVIGPRPHTVTETSVIYTGDNLYEVSYGVTQPGFYKIYVCWGSIAVPECPYICEVTM